MADLPACRRRRLSCRGPRRDQNLRVRRGVPGVLPRGASPGNPDAGHRDHARGTRLHGLDRRDHGLDRRDRALVHRDHRAAPASWASSPDLDAVHRGHPPGARAHPHRRTRRGCCRDAVRGDPFPHRRPRRTDCSLGAAPRDGGRQAEGLRPGAALRGVLRVGRAAQLEVQGVRRVLRPPGEAESSWTWPASRPPFSPAPSSQAPPASLPLGGEQQAPQSSRRQSGRIRPTPAISQGRPCSRPRAPSRARRPEPSTRLSCLGPGYAPRTVSGCAALSCSRTHGVFISYYSLVEVCVTEGGCPRRSVSLTPRPAARSFREAPERGAPWPDPNDVPTGRGTPRVGARRHLYPDRPARDPPRRSPPARRSGPDFPLRHVPGIRCRFARAPTHVQSASLTPSIPIPLGGGSR